MFNRSLICSFNRLCLVSLVRAFSREFFGQGTSKGIGQDAFSVHCVLIICTGRLHLAWEFSTVHWYVTLCFMIFVQYF